MRMRKWGTLASASSKKVCRGPDRHQGPEQVRSTKRRALELRSLPRLPQVPNFRARRKSALAPAAILVRQAFHFLRVGEFDEIEAPSASAASSASLAVIT